MHCDGGTTTLAFDFIVQHVPCFVPKSCLLSPADNVRHRIETLLFHHLITFRPSLYSIIERPESLSVHMFGNKNLPQSPFFRTSTLHNASLNRPSKTRRKFHINPARTCHPPPRRTSHICHQNTPRYQWSSLLPSSSSSSCWSA